MTAQIGQAHLAPDHILYSKARLHISLNIVCFELTADRLVIAESITCDSRRTSASDIMRLRSATTGRDQLSNQIHIHVVTARAPC